MSPQNAGHSPAPTELAIERFGVLFGGRAGLGIEMAARALRGAMPEERA